MGKKFLIALAVLVALNFCVSAFGATSTLQELIVNGVTSYDIDEDSYDEDTGIYIVEPVSFESVKEALEFAEAPNDYFGSNYEVEDDSIFQNITITIKDDDLLGDPIDLSDYSSLSTVVINGGNYSITTNNGDRDILVNNSDITFTVKNLTFNGSGGIKISKTSSATFDNVTFKNIQYSSANGGAVEITGGSGIVFTGCTFDTNEANNGGAIYISSLDDLTFSGTNTFTSNSAEYGGALYFASDLGTTTVNIISNTKFTGNQATDDGGTIYVAGGTINIYSDITSKASNNGGAVYVSSSNGATNIYGILEGNEAVNGGAVYVNSGTVNIYGKLKTNNASTDGGAIYIYSGTVNIETENVIEGNTAGQNGGAIYLATRNSKLNTTGSSTVTFTGNNASSGGGAIYAELGSISFTPETDFIENVVEDGNGGALWLGTAALLNKLEGTVVFDSNEARYTSGGTGNGGAIYIGATTASSVTLSSSHNYTFTNNMADCYGGAIYTVSPDITFDGVTFSDKNTANIGGGFAASESGQITITNSSTISNQEAPKGGAIYGLNITVSSSDLTSNHSKNSANGNEGGGAIYSKGKLILRTAKFEDNDAEEDGGAVYFDSSKEQSILIENSYFNNNAATKGNGGAIYILQPLTVTIKTSTFTINESGTSGGAIYSMGDRPDISYCYFEGNYAENNGGGVYFDQSSATNPDAVFKISYSMLKKNSASGERGGGVCIMANGAMIDSCTFDGNELSTINGTGYGGGLYLNTIVNGETVHNVIDNCTFTSNSVTGGNSGTSGGGGFSVYCEQTTMRSCTFTLNSSANKGGAIHVAEGRLVMSGTIAVGNTVSGTYDIWVDSTIASNGYNRIGVFGQGSGVTDFYSIARQESDRTGYPSKNWTKETFFTSSTLADNERTDLGDNIPPYIGSERAGQLRLQTLMLSEDVTLPLEDRATNIIPYSARQRFPEKDERGVNRRGSGSREIKLDIGAVFFDGTREADSGEETADYSIRAIQISGIPNYLRQPGTTIKLIAKIYYTNGRTIYGGTGTNEESVNWSVSGAGSGYVKIEKTTGVLTVTHMASRPIPAIITVETERLNDSGDIAATDSKYVIVGGYNSGNMNSIPGYNSNNDYLMRELISDFEEYNLGYGFLSDTDIETLQDFLTEIYGLNSASLITDLSGSLPDLISPSTYNSSEGFSPLEGTGITIKLQNVSAGEILPVPYPCNLSGEVLREILGNDLYNSLISDLFVASQNDSTVSDETAQKIFSNLRVDFEDKNGKVWPLIGAESNIDLIDALDCGALVLSSDNDYSGGIHFTLNTCIVNAEAANTDYEGPQLIGEPGEELLMIPDGVEDDEIQGTFWVSRKDLQNSSTSSNSNTKNNSGSKTSSNSISESESSSESSGSGGGGCEIFSFGLIAASLILIFRRK